VSFLKPNVIAPFDRFGLGLNVGDRQRTSDETAEHFLQMSSVKRDQLGIAIPMKFGQIIPYQSNRPTRA
jgi:hypothetical protein